MTNYESAHDTDATMTIDVFIDEDNELIDDLYDDSSWNFHVWNEIWVEGKGHWPRIYAGWAVIDATPQEESNHLMQCGPAPVKAIKQGHIYIGYDTGFVFGEVNGDEIEWICKKKGWLKKKWVPVKMGSRLEFEKSRKKEMGHVG